MDKQLDSILNTQTLDEVLDIKKFPILCKTFTRKRVRNCIRLLRVVNTKGNSSKVIFATNKDKVFAFGVNRDGGLGLNSREVKIARPLLNHVLSGKQVVDIAAGLEHCLALTAAGYVFAWGNNKFGQLGIGSYITQCSPKLIEWLTTFKVIQIKCGAQFSMAVTEDGKLFSWGHNTFGELGNGSYHCCNIPTPVLFNEKIISISCGDCHSIALSESRRAYIWGLNTFGQLGRHPDSDIQISRDKPMSCSPQVLRGFSNIQKAVCGLNHSLILTTDGIIYGFGNNLNGQIGNGSDENQFIPMKINNGTKIKDIFTDFNENMNIAVSEDNRCYVWGSVQKRDILKPKAIPESPERLSDIFGKYSAHNSMFETLIVNDLDTIFKYGLQDLSDNNLNNRSIEETVGKPNSDDNNLLEQTDSHSVDKCLNSIEIKTREESTVSDNQSFRSSIQISNSSKVLLNYMIQSFNNPKDFDLKIRFEDKCIYSHKSILQFRNKKFWQTLSESLDNDTNEVQIFDQYFDHFYAFLQFLYGIEPQLNDDIIFRLKLMAKIFEEKELFDRCSQYIGNMEMNLNLSNVCPLFERAVNEGLADLEAICIVFASNNWKNVVKSNQFLSMNDSLSKRLLVSVIELQ